MNSGEQGERRDEQEASGSPWSISEADDSAETQVDHLGYIGRWDPIPALKKLLERLFPHRRPQED